ncbi:MAG: PVC-type heme-binding CxxCH protein [Aureliella sp.]
MNIRICYALLLPALGWMLAASSAAAQDDSPWASTARTNFKPEIHNANIRSVQLFAQNPEIVTPIGIAVAPDGRVFVQENHTHKRNSSYAGPETDRILVFEDTDGDGVADKRSVFYEGHTFSTDLLFGPDGHLYVSTRWFIGRFKDAINQQAAASEPEILVKCETDGDYPHNGVGGLAIDPANPNWLAFGFGENLGVDYTFVGSDGKTLSGGAEGGSTYRCRTDGSELVRQSTGHWNAFGMAYDLAGNLFSTDNDPNATPPNRLLHVIPGADFGYEYRYGRSGRHPLVCWYGEKPGTLGMIGALGEAACGLVPHGPKQLLSASWTDNRIDLHSLERKGVSFAATREPFLSGPDDFRPVHFSYSADGKYLYFTDWVKLSYPVHGHGRIWRVEFKEPIELAPTTRETTKGRLTAKSAFDSLGSDDPYLRTRAIHHLASSPDVLANSEWPETSDAIVRAHFAVALKRSQLEDADRIIPELLGDSDPDVRYVGIKWIADEKLQTYESELKELLSRADLSRSDLRATMAALERLASGSDKEFSPNDTLLELALDESRPASLRALALQSVQTKHKPLTVELLAGLTKSADTAIKREAIRSLVLHPNPNRVAVLSLIAADESLDEDLRADAIAGMSPLNRQQADMLQSLSQSSSNAISQEAERALYTAGFAKRDLGNKPETSDLRGWKDLVNRAVGEPDTDVGRRLFFHSKLAGCYKCHMKGGRGNAIGPDLTTIRNQSGISSDWLLEHMVNPNAEMAPYYRPQQLLTVDGQVYVGLVIGQEGQKQAYVSNDGEIFFVDKDEVEERRELPNSIMPNGLLDNLKAEEIRDLIAFLLSGE